MKKWLKRIRGAHQHEPTERVGTHERAQSHTVADYPTDVGALARPAWRKRSVRACIR